MGLLENSIWLLVFISCAKATSVSQCVLSDGSLPEVEINNCDTQPCIFYINENSTMTMKFRSPRYIENFQPKATAVALGLNIPYNNLGQPDGCKGIINTICPLVENEYIEYSYSMFMSSLFPPISISLEFSLADKDNNDEPFECFRVDVTLRNKDLQDK